MSLAASRYAEALVALSTPKGKGKASAGDLGGELRQMKELYEKSSEFRTFMIHPRIKPADKKAVLKRVCPELASFLCLLLDKGRLPLIGEIFSEYERLRDVRDGIVPIKVFSAMPLASEQLETIRARYPKGRIETAVQPALLGGVKIVAGDRVTDGTVAARLRALKSHLFNLEVGCGNA